jgi:hypothetical protein
MLVALMLLLPVMGPGDDSIPPPRMTIQAVRLNGLVTIDGIQFNHCNHSLGQMMDIRPDNIFMVKLNYWWNR